MKILRPTYNRRAVIAGIGGVCVLSNAPSLAQTSTTKHKNKVIFVILRGAMDGLGAVIPENDPRLEEYRPGLIPEGSLALSEGFSLHPELEEIHSLFQQEKASILHAASGPYRERSHFLAQDLLESGGVKRPSNDGWLNRTLQVSPTPLRAISIGGNSSLILRGKAETMSWSPSILPEVPDNLITQLQDLYGSDDLLGNALARSMEMGSVANSMMNGKVQKTNVRANFRAAGRLLNAPQGPNIAVLSIGGWDTHVSQLGLLGRRLRLLNSGLLNLRMSLEDSWSNTMIVVATEFGRTVRQNGTRGTDHGTGGAAFLLGGAVRGGRILGDWPGLKESQLYENRDLFPANDLRSLFKGVLTAQFGLSQSDLSNYVFPGSQGVPIIV